ncbi:MAG: laccase domain-containing protein [Clostridia bacterium]|nr:laccase domain-containing protein [Clostridia bacterium]
MFYRDGILEKCSLLDEGDLYHGFSTREGGVSTLPHTATMNVAEGHGDPHEVVRENIRILASTLTDGKWDERAVVCAPQIHSAIIRPVTDTDRGCGVILPHGGEGDGFITDTPGILLMIRVADCVPILYSARRADGSPIVCATHAGWRGTVAGIADAAVKQIVGMGGEIDSIRCAIGQAIHDCCYEVGEDFREAVTAAQGQSFADAHIRFREGKLFADVPGMNRTLLLAAGVREDHIDISPACTACQPHLYHSHRASRGMRGAMGALIGIR